MKIRAGFVSNSSSSSFMIAYKGEKPTKEQIIKALQVNETSPLFGFASDLADFVLNRIDYKYSDKFTTIEDVMEDYGCDEEEELGSYYKQEVELIKQGFTVVNSSASYNEADSPVENYIGNGYLSVKTDTLILQTEEC